MALLDTGRKAQNQDRPRETEHEQELYDRNSTVYGAPNPCVHEGTLHLLRVTAFARKSEYRRTEAAFRGCSQRDTSAVGLHGNRWMSQY